MGQFIQTNGDYNIKTKEGATIKLDTGLGTGEVRVTGNLVVEGDTLTVSAENLNVSDNIIILNYYGDNRTDLPAGVALRYAGIQIDRGSLEPASLIYDDVESTWSFIVGTPESTFNYADSKIKLKEILTNDSSDAGDLTLIGSGIGVVKVGDRGTVGYETYVTDDDDIPNKKYVDDAIRLNPTFQIKSDDSRVIVTDANTPGSLTLFADETSYSTFGESAVSVLVDGILNTQFYKNRAQIQGLEIIGNEITNNDTNGNISLRTQGTGKLKTNYALQLESIGVVPAYVPSSTIVYSSTPSLGTTGIFYVNSSSDSSKRTGELINKNKALVFSMIF